MCLPPLPSSWLCHYLVLRSSQRGFITMAMYGKNYLLSSPKINTSSMWHSTSGRPDKILFICWGEHCKYQGQQYLPNGVINFVHGKNTVKRICQKPLLACGTTKLSQGFFNLRLGVDKLPPKCNLLVGNWHKYVLTSLKQQPSWHTKEL